MAQADPVPQPLTIDHNRVNVRFRMLSGDYFSLQQVDITSSILDIKNLIAEVERYKIDKLDLGRVIN